MSKPTDEELVVTALQSWANWIETGDITLSTRDCVASSQQRKIKGLSLEQQELVLRLRRLAVDKLSIASRGSLSTDQHRPHPVK